MTVSSPKIALLAVRRATLFAVAVVVVFVVFFQLSKLRVIQSINPFADDPYDAVGSIAVQVAFGIGLLSLARLVQQSTDSELSRDKLRFVLRGNYLVVRAAAVTLAVDMLAIVQNPGQLLQSIWGVLLITSIGILAVAIVVAGVLQVLADVRLNSAYRNLPRASTFRSGMLNQAVLDVLALIRIPVAPLIPSLPSAPKPSGRWLKHRWSAALLRPWRFTFIAASVIGIVFFTLHLLEEGIPSDIYATLGLALIFVSVETIAVMCGFAVFGSYLGLRFPLPQSIAQERRRLELSVLRMTMRLILKICFLFLILIFSGIVTFAAFLWLQHNRTAVLPAPTGQYAVGRVAFDWTDTTRPEIFSADKSEKRELMVWVWYPATVSATNNKPADYLPEPWRKAREQDQGFWSLFLTQNLADVQPHAVADAPLASSKSPFPVLVMSPGLGPIATDYTTIAEELASHGYIVVASTPTYSSSVVVFSNGRTVFSSEKANVPDEASPQEAKEILDKLITVWAQDDIFLMDQLEKLNANDSTGRFTGKLDLHSIGIFGHSFGGAAAAQTCRLDSRCKAGANLDGYLYGDVITVGLKPPFMFMWSEPSDPSDAGWQQAVKDADAVYNRLQDSYQLTIKGMLHFNFSDLAVMYSPVIKLKGALGSIDGQRGLKITTDYLTAFFDKFLKGKDSPLLKAPSTNYPEVEFQSRQ